VGDLPVILMELNQSGTVMKTYIYANSRSDHSVSRYFFLHDRLGSVRLATLGVDQIMQEDCKYFRFIRNVFWEHSKE
jgi:hypothetical protein